MKTIVIICALAWGLTSAASAQAMTYRGAIVSIDPDSRVIVLSGSAVSRAFVVADNAEITLKNRSTTTFADLNVGENVEVEFRTVDGVQTVFLVTEVGLKSP